MNATVTQIVAEMEVRIKKGVARMEKAKARGDKESVREERAVCSDLKDLRMWIINQNFK
jgi:hypothetical protein